MTRGCLAPCEAIDTQRTLNMKLRPDELQYLSTWAAEERAPNPYILPAHQLQAEHGVKGVSLIRLIKAWARAEGRKEEEIFQFARKPAPPWPWANQEQLAATLQASET
jgi:hypothetical protein